MVEIGGADSEMSATAPVGVQLAEGATSLTLNVNEMAESQSNVIASEGVNKIALDVHVDGVSASNSVPMLIKLTGLVSKALNSNNIALYHVENGETVAMTLVSEPKNHNEFSYDPATGDIYLCMASFSEVSVIANAVADWNGTVATAFNGGTGTEADPFIIANTDQFAYFRNIVDGNAEWMDADGNEKDRTFAGQYVKLENDINLRWLDANNYPHSFDPIGWGYDNASYNRDGIAGKTFNGIFDGNGKTIFNLYQNGWDLEAMTGTDYTYTNCGGGLFGAICNATIKNLTISSADVKYECVEIGILVGLAQGNCTFDNITIRSSKIANYQRPAGGVVGEVSPKYENGAVVASTCTFSNITIASDVVVGSLWGDFDTPVGGVIGARWDDTNTSKVVMSNCDVACRLDVYNDVTSTYQWYAYRRAGMLIGNTDTPAADGKHSATATADFLTCQKDANGKETVNVYYGNWANYTYCEFSTEHNTYNKWPWVRCQEGENNSSYSNVRYGHPKDAIGAAVYFDEHNHADGEGHLVSIPFNQLYGGGQGIYGQPAHEGVNVQYVAYTITYIVDGEVYAVENVEDNTVDYTKLITPTKTGYEFDRWLDIDSKDVSKISAGNTENIILYCSWADVYIARFLYNDGSVYAEVEFTKKGNSATLKSEEPPVPQIAGYVAEWEPYQNIMNGATSDIVIKPMYTLQDNTQILGTDITTAELFKKLAAGESIAMSKDMTGAMTGGNNEKLCVIEAGKTPRLNLNTYELSYGQDSNANKDWQIFTIKNGGQLTLGSGINGTGNLIFHINAMNSNGSAQLFLLEQGGKLVLEKGVRIEIEFDVDDKSKITLITGITDLDTVHYPGLHITTTEAVNGRMSYIIEVYETTTLTGNDPSVRVN